MDSSSINLSKIPSYGFQFALSNLGALSSRFICLTIISILGGLLGFYATYLLSQLISNISIVTYQQIAGFYIPFFLAAYFIKEFLEYFTRRDGEAFATLAGNSLNQRFFEAILKSESSVLSNLNKEELLVASTRYVSRATTFLAEWFWGTSRNIANFVLVLIILGSQSIYVCLASILYLLIFLSFALKLSRRYAPFAQQVALKGQSVSSQLTQSYLAAQIIRRLRLENFFLGNLRNSLQMQSESVMAAQRFHAKRWLIQLNAFNCLYVSSLFLGIYQVKAGVLPLGFLLLIRYAFERLWDIVVFAIEKYVGLIQEKEEAQILRKILKPLLPSETVSSQRAEITTFSTIKINNLKINLEDGKRCNQFSLSIPELSIGYGERISIKAASGSGKSTFLLSLMGLIPYKGSIDIDGSELAQIIQAPEFVSYVSPSEPLFPLSLIDNITLGRKFDKESLDLLLKGLGITDFVKNPDAIIGDSDINLSLGQSQRIKLARGLIAKSPLLLLDEPFTGLDPESRESIKEFILKWCSKSTIVVASHDSDDRLIASRHLSIEQGLLTEKILS